MRLDLHITCGLICVNNSVKKLHMKLFIYNLLNRFPRWNFDISCQNKNIGGKKKDGLISHFIDTGKYHWFGDH